MSEESEENGLGQVPVAIHKGIPIVYDEDGDQWKFELRGVSRRAKTLRLAKEAIEKPAPKNKVPMPRMPCLVTERWSTHFVTAAITGIAGDDYGGHKELWVSMPSEKGGRPERMKVSLRNVRSASPANLETLAAIEAIRAEIERLDAQRKELADKLEPFVLPADVETGEGER